MFFVHMQRFPPTCPNAKINVFMNEKKEQNNMKKYFSSMRKWYIYNQLVIESISFFLFRTCCIVISFHSVTNRWIFQMNAVAGRSILNFFSRPSPHLNMIFIFGSLIFNKLHYLYCSINKCIITYTLLGVCIFSHLFALSHCIKLTHLKHGTRMNRLQAECKLPPFTVQKIKS